MKSVLPGLSHLTDTALLGEVKRLASAERQATAQLTAALAEIDSRRLYLREGCSSLFSYCTQVLQLSEHAAYGRIAAARAARRLPLVLELLANGDVNLTTISQFGAASYGGEPPRAPSIGSTQEEARGRRTRRKDSAQA